MTYCINVHNSTNYVNGLTIQYNAVKAEKGFPNFESTEIELTSSHFTKEESRGLLAPPSDDCDYEEETREGGENAASGIHNGSLPHIPESLGCESFTPSGNFVEQISLEPNQSNYGNDGNVASSADQTLESLADCNSSHHSAPQLDDIELDQASLFVASSALMSVYLEIFNQRRQEEPAPVDSIVSLETSPIKQTDDDVTKIVSALDNLVESNDQNVHFYQGGVNPGEETYAVSTIACFLEDSIENVHHDLCKKNDNKGHCIDEKFSSSKRKNEAVESEDTENPNEDVVRPKKRTKRRRSKPQNRIPSTANENAKKSIVAQAAGAESSSGSPSQVKSSHGTKKKYQRTDKEKLANNKAAKKYRQNKKLEKGVKDLERDILQAKVECLEMQFDRRVDNFVSLLFDEGKSGDEIFEHACRIIANFTCEVQNGNLDATTLAGKRKLFEDCIMPKIREKHPNMASRLQTAFLVNFIKRHKTTDGDWLTAAKKFCDSSQR